MAPPVLFVRLACLIWLGRAPETPRSPEGLLDEEHVAVVLGEPAPGTTPLVRLRGGRRDPAGSLIHSAPLACSPVAPPSGSRDGRGGEAARRNNEAAQVDGSLGVLVDEVGLHTGGGATDDMALLAVRHPSAVIGHDFLIISVTERVRAASLRITTDVPSEHL